MKQRKRRIGQIFLPVVIALCLTLFPIEAAAITTPWIDVGQEGDTGETGETGNLSGDDDLSSGEGNTSDIEFDFNGDGEIETEAISEKSAGTPKKKGCGSTIQPFVGCAILIFGITEFIFVARKEKHNESANGK